EIGLILILRFRGGSDIVIGSGDIWYRIMLKKLGGNGIEAVGRDLIVGKLSAGRGRGVEDRLGEDSLTLGERRDHAETRDAGAKPRALPIDKEERFVVLDGAAEGQAILISTKLRGWPRLSEQVARIEGFIAEEFEQAAVELIASGFPDHHHGAAIRPAILRRVRID